MRFSFDYAEEIGICAAVSIECSRLSVSSANLTDASFGGEFCILAGGGQLAVECASGADHSNRPRDKENVAADRD